MGLEAGAAPPKPPVYSTADFYACVNTSENEIVGVEAAGSFTPQFCQGQPDEVLTSITGPQGFQGAQGNQGFQGSQGVQGAQGFQGNQGVRGVQGFQGNQGVQGVQGAQGFQGNQGAQGNPGFQGNQGVQGAQGNQGFQGVAGATTVTAYSDNSGTIATGSGHQLSEACPSGTTLTGGGTDIVNGSGTPVPGGTVLQSIPSGNGWVGAVDNETGGNMSQNTYVLCASS